MFKYISIAQSIYLIINLLIFGYLLIIEMVFHYGYFIQAFFLISKKNQL